MTRIVLMYQGSLSLYNEHQGQEENDRKFNFRQQEGNYYFSLNQPSFFPSMRETLEACEIVEIEIPEDL